MKFSFPDKYLMGCFLKFLGDFRHAGRFATNATKSLRGLHHLVFDYEFFGEITKPTR
jgi:hypothetical protein